MNSNEQYFVIHKYDSYIESKFSHSVILDILYSPYNKLAVKLN